MNKVYFITPTYNASYHLEDLYESLLEQTNKNWKWFILNDMSNDDTLEIAQKIENKDKLKRVSVIAWSEKKFALKGICDCLSTFKEIYTQYSRHPRDVIKDMESDISIRVAIENGEIPSVYNLKKQSIQMILLLQLLMVMMHYVMKILSI